MGMTHRMLTAMPLQRMVLILRSTAPQEASIADGAANATQSDIDRLLG